MHNHMYMPDEMWHDILSAEALQKADEKTDDTPPYIVIWSHIYVDDNNKTTKDDKYPWSDRENKGKICQIGKS